MKTRHNILSVFPDPADATSFYRGMGVIGYMRKIDGGDFEYTPCPKGMTLTWAVLQQADILYLQRPFTPQHTMMANMAKANGLKLWVDWDDDLLNIPLSNYTHKIYHSRRARENVKSIIELADLCTVSTKHLKYIFGDRENTHVVPNAINTDLFQLEKRTEQNKFVKVFWRGGKSHVEDLMVYADAIEAVVKSSPGVSFTFCGEPEWPIIQKLNHYKNVEFVEAKDVIEYHFAYKKLRPDISIVPLKDEPFNHSKSMCAWLEATYAGSCVLGPDFDEWKRDGIANYSDPKSFIELLKELIDSPEKRIEMQNKSVDLINNELTLHKTCQRRIDLLKKMLNK